MGDTGRQLAEGDQACGVGQLVLVLALLGFAQFALGHVAGDQRVVALAASGTVGQQHHGNRHRGTAARRQQARVDAPYALAFGAAPAFALQARQVIRGDDLGQGRHRLFRPQPERAPRRRVEVGDVPGGVDEEHRVGIGFHHFGQAPLVLLGLHPRGDVARHADHLHHRPGIGLADGTAGGLEPEVMPGAVADAIGHGEVAVLLQSVAGALHQLGHLLRVEQALGELTAQLLRPITKQRPGRG
ncbi:hypothetical protein D3C85_755930 [compost metagenome]